MKIPQKWTFEDADVASGFDLHVREQLPWYDIVTGAIAHVVRHYLPNKGRCYDIGASTGNIGRAIAETIKERNAELIAIEKSKEMASIYSAPGKCVVADAMDVEFLPYDVAICFLVLMFLTPGKRKQWVQSLANQLRPGGALIIVDKVSAPSGYLGTVFHRMTLAGKVASGVNPSDIIAKELSLSGVQRPLDIRLINNLTPSPVEIFRFGEFAGWVLARPE
jgi:tRNA (cmo5U34)-methyltransferase